MLLLIVIALLIFTALLPFACKNNDIMEQEEQADGVLIIDDVPAQRIDKLCALELKYSLLMISCSMAAFFCGIMYGLRWQNRYFITSAICLGVIAIVNTIIFAIAKSLSARDRNYLNKNSKKTPALVALIVLNIVTIVAMILLATEFDLLLYGIVSLFGLLCILLSIPAIVAVGTSSFCLFDSDSYPIINTDSRVSSGMVIL